MRVAGTRRPLASRVWTVTFVAPTLGVAVLIFLCGGADRLWDAYRINVQKSLVLPYAIETGDGPWHRYLLDLFTVNPAVMLLAVGGFFRALRPEKAAAGTIRKEFATNIERNAVHGSDAPETAAEEIAFFFPASELVTLAR